jgi:hypothetical protein
MMTQDGGFFFFKKDSLKNTTYQTNTQTTLHPSPLLLVISFAPFCPPFLLPLALAAQGEPNPAALHA